jgi:hypothetical protein
VDLTLNEAQRAHLAALGIEPDAQGDLRAADGRPVSAAAAVTLAKAAVSPADFRRGYLREGHAAENAAQWTTGVPGQLAQGAAARTGPAGPGGPAGSGTPDGSMAGGSGDEVDPDMAGTGDDAAGMAKEGLLANSLHRHYLTAGHASDSPANGPQRVIPAPHMDGTPGGAAHVAGPRQFGRGPLTAGHQADPPASDHMGNNGQPPGTPAHEVYAAAERQWAQNVAAARASHVTPSTMGPAAPLPQRVMLPADMRAGSVPMAAQVHATRPAPGEGVARG